MTAPTSWSGFLVGCVTGVLGTLIRVLFVRPRTTLLPNGPVPAELLLPQATTPNSVDVWRWSMALTAEDDERRTVGYETNGPRSSDAASAQGP